MNIKLVKKIIFFMQLSIAITVHGECVQDGMNLWQLAECIACSVGAQYEIKQSNYLTPITAPGHYKLCENIVDPGTGPIFITNGNVIFDLGGYSIDGILSLTIDTGVSNVVIRNGLIKNAANGCILSGNNQNIVIEDITFDTIRNISVPGSAVQSLGDVNGLLVRNVSVYNGSPLNFFIQNSSGSNKNIFFENVECIGFNPAYTSPLNPSFQLAVLYAQECDNLWLKNITITDEFADINGIWFDTCTNIHADGVVITSSLAVPPSPRNAYLVDACQVGLHENISIDGGTNVVFARAINAAGSTLNTFDVCSVMNVSNSGITVDDGNTVLNSTADQCGANGFVIASNVYLENCSALNNSAGQGYLVGGSSFIKNCSAFNNATSGFGIVGLQTQCIGCVAERNSIGFSISVDGCSLDTCYANYNTTDGFSVVVTDGCFITNSVANDNANYGFGVFNINAEANFSAGNPVDGTWNIGQFTPLLVTTNNHNIRLANNTALRNGVEGFAMFGTVYTNNGGATPLQVFATQIFPPIGVLNTIRGAIFNDSKPLPNTSLGATTGLAGSYANAIGGNLINDKP